MHFFQAVNAIVFYQIFRGYVSVYGPDSVNKYSNKKVNEWGFDSFCLSVLMS